MKAHLQSLDEKAISWATHLQVQLSLSILQGLVPRSLRTLKILGLSSLLCKVVFHLHIT
jgi:hypothetical protein